MGAFSPDGKWMAYWTDEPGHPEIFVASFPDGAVRRRVSTDIGQYPQWSKDGRVLYYVNGKRQLTALPFSTTGTTFELGQPKRLGEVPGTGIGPPFSLTADGRILAVFEPSATQPRPIIVVLNAATT